MKQIQFEGLVKCMNNSQSGADSDSFEEELYFNYSTTLRIFGKNLDLELINNTMNIQPTHCHRQGEYHRKNKTGTPYPTDMWSYHAPVPDDEHLDVHIQSLWVTFKPFKEFLLSLKEKYTVDIFCGYRSNCDNAGFEVSPKSLEVFIELDIPFGVSVIIA